MLDQIALATLACSYLCSHNCYASMQGSDAQANTRQYIRLRVNNSTNSTGRYSQLSQHSKAFCSFPTAKQTLLQPLPSTCGPALHDALKVSLFIDGLIVTKGKGKHAINYELSQLPALAAQVCSDLLSCADAYQAAHVHIPAAGCERLCTQLCMSQPMYGSWRLLARC